MEVARLSPLRFNEISFYQNNLNDMKKKAGGSDKELVLLEEEIEALRNKRPPSLRVNAASGKKERDPQYHCLMEQVRRRTMKHSISRLRTCLPKGPQRHSLQTVLEGALKEVAAIKKKERAQQEQIASQTKKRESLKQRLRELGSYPEGDSLTSGKCTPEPEINTNSNPSPLPMVCTYTSEISTSPLSSVSSGSLQSLSSLSSGSTVTPVPLTMPFYPQVMLQSNSIPQQQFPKLVMYPFLSGMPMVSPPFNPVNTYCRVIPQNHFFPTLVSTVRQAN